MTRKLKINIVIVTGIIMVVTWAALYFMGSKDQTINYVWQAFMAFFAVFYGVLGLSSAKHWGGTKSSNGQGVFAISLGLISWGLGQAGWTYYLFAEPNVQSPTNHFIDTLYMLAIPLWAFGIYRIAKATGARYGLKSATPKILLAAFTVLMFIASYILLVEVARGGTSYFHGQSFWNAFFQIGYVFGDVLLITLVISIYGLSWKYLGGMFKKPIIIMFLSFVFIYLADFWWAFRDGKGLYYNGDTPDLFYILTVITFGLGLTLLDPSEKRRALTTATVQPLVPDVPNEPSVATEPAAPAVPPQVPITEMQPPYEVPEPTAAVSSEPPTDATKQGDSI